MKILLDMNLSPAWVEFLQREGFEAVHWSTVGDIRASDATIMDWARDNGCVVFTHDLDSSALLAATQEAGQVWFRSERRIFCPAPSGGISFASCGFVPRIWIAELSCRSTSSLRVSASSRYAGVVAKEPNEAPPGSF